MEPNLLTADPRLGGVLSGFLSFFLDLFTGLFQEWPSTRNWEMDK